MSKVLYGGICYIIGTIALGVALILSSYGVHWSVRLLTGFVFSGIVVFILPHYTKDDNERD